MKVIVSGSARELPLSIASKVNHEYLIADVERFSNGEMRINIDAVDLTAESVYIIHSYGSSISSSLVELFFLISKIKSLNPRKMYLVLPYLCYSRQDKVSDTTSQCIGKILKSIGVDKIISIDVHSENAIKFIGLPLDNLSTSILFSNFIASNLNKNNVVLVSPDKGSSDRVKKISDITKIPYIVLNKIRDSLGKVQYSQLNVDIRNKVCCIIDDIIDTGATIFSATKLLLENGAKSVHCCVTHVMSSENLFNAIDGSDIKSFAVTDSNECVLAISLKKVKIISVADLISCHIRLMEKTDNV